MINDEELNSLLIKYIVKEANDAEIVQIRTWLKAHPENEQYFVQLYNAWHSSMLLDDINIDVDQAYNDFKTSHPLKKQKQKLWLFTYLPHLIALLSLGAAIWWFYPRKGTGYQHAMKLVTSRGSVRKYELPDHTVIWLNAGSNLSIDPGFNVSNRTVFLEGEAFFEIGHVKNQFPFLVKTNKFSIRDIGTKFNVKAYPEDKFFEASVMAGAISVENGSIKETGNNRIYLKAHQVLRVSRDNPQPVPGISDVKSNHFDRVQVEQIAEGQQINYSGWKDNVLVFNDSSLEEIATQLSRHFNITLNIADDQLKQLKYSGTFKNISTVDLILEAIKENTDINYTKQGNTITITGGKNMK
ncbi:FecR family protein [Mucilaginibacter litoreus]|uniref:FecR family protein n=1 Tax=Mucilaginibacter litoreus TaxID=1048221 RepID=A0ABW3AU97_9SPHI